MRTVQEARAPSTRAAYLYWWGMFSAWCEAHQVDPYLATAQDILLFLQSQLEAGKSAVTLRGMVGSPCRRVRLDRGWLLLDFPFP